MASHEDGSASISRLHQTERPGWGKYARPYETGSKQLGKPSGNDLNSGIITLPAIIASENGAKDKISKFFNSREEAKSDLLPITIEAIIQTGALEKTNEVANNYIKAAMKSLDDIPPSEYRDSMISLAEYVPKRKY